MSESVVGKRARLVLLGAIASALITLGATPASASWAVGPCGYNYTVYLQYDLVATQGSPSDGCGYKEVKARYYVPGAGYYTTPALSKQSSASLKFYTYPIVGGHHRWTGISSVWTYQAA